MITVINILAIVGVIVGLIVAGVGFAAGMDPEGRGGNYVLGGFAGFVVACGCAVYLIIVGVRHFL